MQEWMNGKQKHVSALKKEQTKQVTSTSDLDLGKKNPVVRTQ